MKTSDTSKDFERIEESFHVQKVLELLNKTVPKYVDQITASSGGGSGFIKGMEKLAWNEMFTDAIDSFQKEANAYQDFFSEDNIEEFEEVDDAKSFKTELKNKCPIIRKTFNSSAKELQNWKEDYTRSKPQDLLDTFTNFLDYAREYVEESDGVNYNILISYEDFEELAHFSDDEDLTLKKVIGAGIKTTVIYHLFPDKFCKSVRRTLYGLHFLTLDIQDKMPSRSGEFVMIDDTDFFKGGRNSVSNFRIEHNYWYPFNLFMLYTNHIYMIMEKMLKKYGVVMDKNYRFVFVCSFLDRICDDNIELVKTMMGNDQKADLAY